MDFVRYHEASRSLFIKLLRWTSTRITTCERITHLQERVTNVPKNDLITINSFRARVDAEIMLSRQQRRPLCLMLCRMDGRMTASARYILVRILRRLFGHLLGPNDTAALNNEQDHAEFWFLLPDSDLERAHGVQALIEHAIEAFDFRPYGNSGQLRLVWAIQQLAKQHDEQELRRAVITDMESP